MKIGLVDHGGFGQMDKEGWCGGGNIYLYLQLQVEGVTIGELL